MERNFAIVTPVKNEEKYFGETIRSVLSQTVRPQRWVIINDGSTDRTGEMVKELEQSHSWIHGLHRKQSRYRKPGGESLISIGIQELNLSLYDFFVRMDGDLSFADDYFDRLFEKFENNPKLGIAGGVCYVQRGERLVEEKHVRFHTRGPLKTYQIRCFNNIGGLEPGLGWDTVDEVKANMRGWQTRSYPELKIIHLRPTQTASGAFKGMRNHGESNYYVGYHPLFMLLKTVRRLTHRPYILGGVNLLIGYLNGYVRRWKQIDDQQFIRYIRQQQINKIIGRETIWK